MFPIRYNEALKIQDYCKSFKLNTATGIQEYWNTNIPRFKSIYFLCATLFVKRALTWIAQAKLLSSDFRSYAKFAPAIIWTGDLQGILGL